MDAKKRKRLEAKGWKAGTSQEFLELSDDEALFVEIKLALARAFSVLRRQHGTQTHVAKLLGSNQSRVAKMEAGDRTVSLDLLTRGLLVLGATRADLAGALKSNSARPKKKTTARKGTKKRTAKKRAKKGTLVSR